MASIITEVGKYLHDELGGWIKNAPLEKVWEIVNV